MGKVLYECRFEFDFVMLVPWIMLIGILLMPIILKHDSQKKGYYINSRLVKIFCLSAGIFVLVITVFIVVQKIDEYKKVAVAYDNDNYRIVEGYVKSFDPMPYSGHKHESFEVNDVRFEYSDFEVTIGYHNAKSHGGVIKGDGQYLKIGYVNYWSRNHIVYIEEFPEKNMID